MKFDERCGSTAISKWYSRLLDGQSDCGKVRRVDLKVDTNGGLYSGQAYKADSCAVGGSCNYAEFRLYATVVLDKGCLWHLSTTIYYPNLSVNLAGWGSYYLELEVDRRKGFANTSPRFLSNSRNAICSDLPLNIGAWDPDGDRLFYEIVCTKQEDNECVTYVYGHSWPEDEPIATIKIDSLTGELSMDSSFFSPGYRFVVSVKVSEYSVSGDYHGHSFRHLRLSVGQNCRSYGPSIELLELEGASVSSTDPYVLRVCAGDTVGFSLKYSGINSFNIQKQAEVLTNISEVLQGATYVLDSINDSSYVIDVQWPSVYQPYSQPSFLLGLNFACGGLPSNSTFRMNIVCKPAILDEVDSESIIEVFPNPTTGQVYVESNNPVVEFELWSIDGRLLRSYPGTQGEIDVSEFSKGVYLMRVITSDGQAIKKILLQ